MNLDLPRIIDSIHREKGIPKAVLIEAIQTALLTAAKKHYADTDLIQIRIDPDSLQIIASKNGDKLDPADFGRIAAQTAKQVIIQKFREAERDTLFDEFEAQRGDLLTGTVQRFESGGILVNLGKTDSLLPRNEQIPGESHHPGERIRAVVSDVKKTGQRVKIILSRSHPDFVRRLFELEIPEIADQTIAIRALAREAGYRSKVAVASIDSKVDAVGACVGVRGTRIKNIVDELGGERIDIVRYSDDPETLIRASLQPAEVDQVLLCDMIGRAIVLVREDQLSLAIGRKGQNVRLASKLSGWDIEIMTNDELEQQIERAVGGFMQIEGMTEEVAQRLVEQGYLSYDDLSVIEPDALLEMGGLTAELVDAIVAQADVLALEAEKAADNERRRKRAETIAADAADAAAPPAAAATDAAAPPVAEATPVEPAAATVEPVAEATPPAPADEPAAPKDESQPA